MKKKSNRNSFAESIQNFFVNYLGYEKNVSPNTIRSYRDTFVFFLDFMREHHDLEPDKVKLEHIDRSTILSFLDWLETTKNSSCSTRNQRCAAIKSFTRYMMYREPNYLSQWSNILSIKVKQKVTETVKHLSVEAITKILSSIPQDTPNGQRDFVLLSLLYYTGARVSELTSLTTSSVRLEPPYIVELFGKGSKKRVVPIDEPMSILLKNYMNRNRMFSPNRINCPLFFNGSLQALSTPGVTYVINKYVESLRKEYPKLFPINVTPHIFRHSRAMHLLEAGVNLIIIRDLLGHTTIKTTEVYARANSKAKNEAIEKAYSIVGQIESETKSWEQDAKLKAFLKSLS